MDDTTTCNADALFTRRLRRFNLIFVPLLIFSLAGQVALLWTQLAYIRDGYFDFVLYHSAARIIADGRGRELYDLKVQKNYQEGPPGRASKPALPFNHLPYELVILLPLAQLSFPVADLVWAAMNLLLLFLILIRLAPFVTTIPWYVTTLMFFALFPTWSTFKMGQDSMITTYLLTETFISLKLRRNILAGCVLALGLYKPQFVLPLTAILLCRRRWRAVAGFLVTAILLMGASLAFVGWQGMTGLLALWLPMTERGNVVWPELMLNLRGLFYLLLDVVHMTSLTNLLTLIFSVLVFVLTLNYWRRSTDEMEDDFDLKFALAIVMTVLVSFHLYYYDGTILAIALVLVFNSVLKARLHSTSQLALLPLLIVLYFPLLPNVLLAYAALAWWALPLPLLFGVIKWQIDERARLRAVLVGS